MTDNMPAGKFVIGPGGSNEPDLWVHREESGTYKALLKPGTVLIVEYVDEPDE